MTGKQSTRGWITRGLGLVLVGLLALPMAASAQDRPVRPANYSAQGAGQQQGKATLDVVVVRADKSGVVAPGLKQLERQLSFTGFTGFKVVSEEAVRLGKGQESSVSGGAGYKLNTELVSFDDDYARVRVQILKGSESRVDTTVRLLKNKAFTVKGPKVDGGAMVYVITYK
jgi:hypothetical protein